MECLPLCLDHKLPTKTDNTFETKKWRFLCTNALLSPFRNRCVRLLFLNSRHKLSLLRCNGYEKFIGPLNSYGIRPLDIHSVCVWRFHGFINTTVASKTRQKHSRCDGVNDRCTACPKSCVCIVSHLRVFAHCSVPRVHELIKLEFTAAIQTQIGIHERKWKYEFKICK